MIQAVVRWNVVVTGVSIALGYAGFALLGCRADPGVLALTAGGTFVVYGMDRRATFSPEDRRQLRLDRPIPASTLAVVVAAMGVLAWRQGQAVCFAILGLGALGALYILPLLPGRRRLKDVAYLKTLVVALGWAVATVLLPAIGAGVEIQSGIWCLAGYRLVFLLPNLLLADWPDRDADRAAAIRTFANQFPTRQFVWVCRATCLAAIGTCLWLVDCHFLPAWALAESAAPIAFLVLLARPLPQSRLFYASTSDALLAWPGIVAAVASLSHF